MGSTACLVDFEPALPRCRTLKYQAASVEVARMRLGVGALTQNKSTSTLPPFEESEAERQKRHAEHVRKIERAGQRSWVTGRSDPALTHNPKTF
jgi:hypothetical protein